MQGGLIASNATLTAGWNNSRSTVAFGTELLSSNDNLGLTGILAPNAMARVETELDGLSKLGVQFVVTAVSFPILYQPFYDDYLNEPQDYQQVLTFYQNVMAAIRARGMRVLIESTVVFPSYATDLPLNQYYATLSPSDLTAGRAQVAQIVAQTLQPDWLDLGSEPDTISALVGLPAEFTPDEWAADISTIVAQLRSAGIHGKPEIGAGCGAWQINGSDYVQALMSTGIDYFDMHVFSVNLGGLTQAEAYLDMAIVAGKPVAISETWEHKLTDAQLQGQSEYGIISALSSVEPFNAYSFWATQDAEFLGEMIDLAYWKQLIYLAPFDSDLFFAYVDYNQTANLSPAQLTSAETSAESAALNAGTLSSLGLWFTAAIQPVNAVTISAAWNSGAAPVAPASVVSVYGANLADMSAPAPSLPLPITLAGTSATLTDATGVQTRLPLFYAGPSQIDAEIPATASEGPAVITVNAPSGPVSSPVVIAPVSPGLFTENQSGQGVAAAQFANNQNGQQTLIDIFNCASGGCVGVPLDVSSGSSALVLFGTGIQNRTSLSDVTVTISNQTIGTLTLPAFYAGPTGYVGEDQVNVYLPASLAGSGTVNISVSVAGTPSNTVTATFK